MSEVGLTNSFSTAYKLFTGYLKQESIFRVYEYFCDKFRDKHLTHKTITEGEGLDL